MIKGKDTHVDSIVGVDELLFAQGMVCWREHVLKAIINHPKISICHIDALHSMLNEKTLNLFFNSDNLKEEIRRNKDVIAQDFVVKKFIRDIVDQNFPGYMMANLSLLEFDYASSRLNSEVKDVIKLLWNSLTMIDEKYHFLKSYFIFAVNKEPALERKDYLMYLNESFNEIEKNLGYFNFYDFCGAKQRDNCFKTRIPGIFRNFITFPLPNIKVSKHLDENFELMLSFYDRLKVLVMSKRLERLNSEYQNNTKTKEQREEIIRKLMSIFERSINEFTKDFAGLNKLEEKLARKNLLEEKAEIVNKLRGHIRITAADYPSATTNFDINDVDMSNVKRHKKKLTLLIEIPSKLTNRFTTEFLFQKKMCDFNECEINFERINTGSIKVEIEDKTHQQNLLNKSQEITTFMYSRIEELLLDYKEKDKHRNKFYGYNFKDSKERKYAQEKQEEFFLSASQNIRSILLHAQMEKIEKTEVVSRRRKI